MPAEVVALRVFNAQLGQEPDGLVVLDELGGHLFAGGVGQAGDRAYKLPVSPVRLEILYQAAVELQDVEGQSAYLLQ